MRELLNNRAGVELGVLKQTQKKAVCATDICGALTISCSVNLVPMFFKPFARSASCCHWCSSDSDLSVMQRVVV